MHFGASMFFTDYSMTPKALARALGSTAGAVPSGLTLPRRDASAPKSAPTPQRHARRA